MIPLIGPIISALGTLGSSWLDKKKIEADGKIKIAEAKIDAQVKAAASAESWDEKAVEGMSNSWKDEFLVLVLSAPFIASFIPTIQDFVITGWTYVSQAPDWYQWAFLGAITASFGLRWMNKTMLKG